MTAPAPLRFGLGQAGQPRRSVSFLPQRRRLLNKALFPRQIRDAPPTPPPQGARRPVDLQGAAGGGSGEKAAPSGFPSEPLQAPSRAPPASEAIGGARWQSHPSLPPRPLLAALVRFDGLGAKPRRAARPTPRPPALLPAPARDGSAGQPRGTPGSCGSGLGIKAAPRPTRQRRFRSTTTTPSQRGRCRGSRGAAAGGEGSAPGALPAPALAPRPHRWW